jgi:hypothetical protein
MPYQPSAIVSMQFFNCNAATSITTQKFAEHDTEFFSSDGTKVGSASTTQKITSFSSKYYNAQGHLIGTSESEWAGTVISTLYYINNQKVGTSTTTWGFTEFDTDYYDLNSTQINRSHTSKNFDTSKTNYNLPPKPKKEAPALATNASATFAQKKNPRPQIEAQKKQGKCCSIM